VETQWWVLLVTITPPFLEGRLDRTKVGYHVEIHLPLYLERPREERTKRDGRDMSALLCDHARATVLGRALVRPPDLKFPAVCPRAFSFFARAIELRQKPHGGQKRSPGEMRKCWGAACAHPIEALL
jgi:hypothetical protein